MNAQTSSLEIWLDAGARLGSITPGPTLAIYGPGWRQLLVGAYSETDLASQVLLIFIDFNGLHSKQEAPSTAIGICVCVAASIKTVLRLQMANSRAWLFVFCLLRYKTIEFKFIVMEQMKNTVLLPKATRKLLVMLHAG